MRGLDHKKEKSKSLVVLMAILFGLWRDHKYNGCERLDG